MSKMSPAKLLAKVSDIKEKLKSDKVVIKMFSEYNLDISDIEYIPVKFGKIDTSATTDHGIITINEDLIENIGDIDHYLVHEITHYLQQTTGNAPTKGSSDGDYLDNKFEIEGFQNQTEYMSENISDEAAEHYIDKVMDKHEVEDEERAKIKKDLLRLANWSRYG